jgi:hypothetical protein
MNRLRFLFTAALAGAITMSFSAALAQQNHEQHAAGQSAQSSTPADKGTTTQGHMMMGMMNDPVHQSAMTVFVLPELQSELGLSAQQVTDLRKLKQDLVTKTKDLAADTKNKELENTLAKMKATLAEDQRTKLAAMKPMEIHQLAMSRVPMNEHPTMAGFYSRGQMGHGMMGEGMMGKGMMGKGMMKKGTDKQ